MPTVTEKIQYALQGPNEKILTVRGQVPDATHPEFWHDNVVHVHKLHNELIEALRGMGIADVQYEVVTRRVLTVITDPVIVEG